VTDLTLPLDQLPDPLPIEPLSRPFDLAITPPGSKSLTCRAYLLAAMADGESRIKRPLVADDTERLLTALETMGAGSRRDEHDVLIRGVSGRFPMGAGGGTLNLGDGGAPARFMVAAACLAARPVTVDGSPRLRERPVAEGVELLRRLGAAIRYVGPDGRLPVRVTPRALHGGVIEVGRTLSSQFISAIMLIAPWLPDPLTLHLYPSPTSASYVRLTTHVLRQWGLRVDDEVDADGEGVTIRLEAKPLAAGSYTIEPDASAATYWLAAAAIVPGAAVKIDGLAASSSQGDAQFARILAGAGACAIEGDQLGLRHAGRLSGVTCDLADMPDASMTLLAAIATAGSPSTITGLRTLRVKESDRIAALATELDRIGCTVQTTDDSITVDPRTGHENPVQIETYNDHRMAMAFAVLGLARPGISIKNPACVSKSYPSFWRDLARLYD